jgi:hypothetical protein
MSTTLQRAPVRSSPRNGIDELKLFLAENRGVLRFMEKSRRQKSLVIESALRDPHDRGKEPPRFRIIDTGDAASAYSLIVDYFKRYGYNDPLLFAEGRVSLSLSCGNFGRTTDDLKRDLKLFERSLPDTIAQLDEPQRELLERVKDRPDLATACLKFLDKEVTRPEYAKLSAELTEARLDREREQRRLSQARYRARKRADVSRAQPG